MHSPGRTEAFSDGIFAIAITLLVLDLHVPGVHTGLLAALAAQWPHYAAYAVSFLTVGIIWVNHHAFVDRLQRVNRPLLFLNLLFLLFVSVLPFPTSLLSSFLEGSQGPVAAAVYSANMAAMGGAFGAMVIYAVRHGGLLTPSAAAAIDRRYLARFTFGGLVYVIAAATAFVDTRISLAVIAALAVYYALLSPPGHGRGHGD
jgi:uncharacterized membrane protein